MFLVPPVNFRYKNALMANRVTPGEVWVGKNRLMCTERWQVARTEGPKPKTQICRGMKLKKRKYQNLKSKNKRFHLLHPSILFLLHLSSNFFFISLQWPTISSNIYTFSSKKIPYIINLSCSSFFVLCILRISFFIFFNLARNRRTMLKSRNTN